MWTLDGGLDADGPVGAILNARFGGGRCGLGPAEVAYGRSSEANVLKDIDLGVSVTDEDLAGAEGISHIAIRVETLRTIRRIGQC